MNFVKTGIEGVVIIEPRVFEDERGYFYESFRKDEFARNVTDADFVQDNESYSKERGVVRGLHFQTGEWAQAKLVRVVKGMVQDVAVDLREGSPTFGKYVSVILSESNKKMLYIPRGFAHGYAVLQPDSVFQYKCDNYYAPDHQGGWRWNDPFFGIKWEVEPSEVILSAKDAAAPLFETR
ncbi:MAG: dTDP-4-dehydrorhamnose 3,5-epimerase [Bacteroidales bacterium]|nr:dTDP-4-dehydrorhamnose 3,5-epimerase [Bacteroidales bacterium]